jgi:hypothetical protein
MKKLLFILFLAAVAYGAWKYMEAVQQKTTEKQGTLKQSEKALKEMDKEGTK